jgi:hypothetical protein
MAAAASDRPTESRAAGCLHLLGSAGVLLAAIFAGEMLKGPFAPMAALIAPYRSILRVTLIGMTILGGLLFVGGFAVMLVRSGRPMAPEEVDELMRRRSGRRLQWYRFRGRKAGREVRWGADFSEIKEAWKTGAWWRDPVWRPFFILLASVLLLFVGGFGLSVLLGPPAVKIIVGAMCLYAAVRLVWAFWRA